MIVLARELLARELLASAGSRQCPFWSAPVLASARFPDLSDSDPFSTAAQLLSAASFCA